MKKFSLWLMENVNNITINMQFLKKNFEILANDYISREEDNQELIKIFDINVFFKKINNNLKDYPEFDSLINSLKSKNENYIWDQLKKLRLWLNSIPYNIKKSKNIILSDFYTYVDYINNNINLNYKEDIYNSINKVFSQSYENMKQIKNLIEASILNIANWNGSEVTIIALTSDEKNIKESNNAEIKLGTNQFSPSFVLFYENDKILIDDILEGGDEDFFNTPEIQSDYFNLINEIKNPGSLKKGKILTLYTSRPKKDRQNLLQMSFLPINIFLTNNFEHAVGLANDLSNQGEIRDVWKIKINSIYLTQTLDGPIKYYQVTVNNAPAKMELFSVN